jgi:hypothetical protein
MHLALRQIWDTLGSALREVVAQGEATPDGGVATKSDATTSRGECEANGRQEAEAAHQEAAAQQEWRDER